MFLHSFEDLLSLCTATQPPFWTGFWKSKHKLPDDETQKLSNENIAELRNMMKVGSVIPETYFYDQQKLRFIGGKS